MSDPAHHGSCHPQVWSRDAWACRGHAWVSCLHCCSAWASLKGAVVSVMGVEACGCHMKGPAHACEREAQPLRATAESGNGCVPSKSSRARVLARVSSLPQPSPPVSAWSRSGCHKSCDPCLGEQGYASCWLTLQRCHSAVPDTPDDGINKVVGNCTLGQKCSTSPPLPPLDTGSTRNHPHPPVRGARLSRCTGSRTRPSCRTGLTHSGREWRGGLRAGGQSGCRAPCQKHGNVDIQTEEHGIQHVGE
jgi:hypothetical protein